MNIGFIGAGKAGSSLGKFFADSGCCVTGYYSLHESSARAVSEFTGSKCFKRPEEVVKESDAVFLTVPDAAIGSVYDELRNFDIEGRHICHCSGVMTAAEAFPDIRRRKAFGYSVHPLFPFSGAESSKGDLAGAFFCIEGNEEHLSDWKSFLENLGLNVQIISPESKPRYHAACAIASNLVCALMDESVELLTECGFTRESALSALTPLIRKNTENILKYGPASALSGAVERNDIKTVKKHLDCFPTAAEKEMYRAVSERLIKTARAKNPDTDYSELEKLLMGGNQK